MRLLLDTHAFLWMGDSPERLGAAAREALLDPSHRAALSLASVWEMAIKIGLGKLTLSTSLDALVAAGMTRARIELLPIELSHVLHVQDLPWHHRDPFDRLLVAQALAASIPIVSRDTALDAYGVRRIW
jgi:PIN domain nuclease of toxin-antitoxin system